MISRLSNCLILLVVLILAACADNGGKAPASNAASSDTKTTTTTESKPASASGSTAARTETTAAAPAAAAETAMAPTPGTTTRDTELKDKPFIDATTLKTLPAKTAVTLVDRSGGWYKIVTGGQQGWVRLLHVSSQPGGASASSKQELEAAAKLVTGRAGGGNIVSTTGIRGLSEEQLRKAQPSPAELQRLDSYAASPEQASVYAHAQKLERRQVAQLPAPK
jgi:hypothetical protein